MPPFLALQSQNGIPNVPATMGTVMDFPPTLFQAQAGYDIPVELRTFTMSTVIPWGLVFLWIFTNV